MHTPQTMPQSVAGRKIRQKEIFDSPPLLALALRDGRFPDQIKGQPFFSTPRYEFFFFL